MIRELVNAEGILLSDYIRSIPDELPQDGVGLYQIVAGGADDYNLGGLELVDFVRRGILALLDAGAIPVRFGGGTGFDWVAQHQYGTNKQEIAEAVIAEWLSLPDDNIVLFSQGVWFARPILGSRNVKID